MTQRTTLSMRHAAWLLIGFLVQACSAPSDNTISRGDASFGSVTDGRNMAEHYYPKTAGSTYVYSNTITTYDGLGNPSGSYSGGFDTLRTLGYQGFNSPEGEPVYAFSVTYRVAVERDNKTPFLLHMVRNGNSSAFIAGNDPAGFNDVESIGAVTASIDTILYAVEGPARDVIDNVNSSKVYRTDVIYFTSTDDMINIWWYDNGVMRKTRMVWDASSESEWSYGLPVGDPYTRWHIRDHHATVATPAGSFAAKKTEASTVNLETSAKEFKYWGLNTGLVLQTDEWNVTSDGTTFLKKMKVRELISIQ